MLVEGRMLMQLVPQRILLVVIHMSHQYTHYDSQRQGMLTLLMRRKKLMLAIYGMQYIIPLTLR